VIEYVRKGPDGYRPKVLQVPVGDAIRASAGGWFCEFYCGFGHAGGGCFAPDPIRLVPSLAGVSLGVIGGGGSVLGVVVCVVFC